jgi:hypothetical protein
MTRAYFLQNSGLPVEVELENQQSEHPRPRSRSGFDRWATLGYALGGGLIGGVVLERSAAVSPGLTATGIDTGAMGRQLMPETNWAEQDDR